MPDPAREFIQGPEELLGPFAVKHEDLLGVGEKVRTGLLGEFALNFDRLIERPHHAHSLDQDAAGKPRFSRVVVT